MSAWEWAAVGAAGVAALVAVALTVLWSAGVRLLGPVFRYELVRLARKGTQPRLRALLVGMLLIGLLIAYLHEFRGQEWAALFDGVQMPLDRQARFSETFLIAFSAAQLLAVVLITPALVGGAVAEEKERGTLDFLRSSLLTNHEIVFGKLAARLVFVGGVVLAGAPVLASTLLFGGVDVRVLAGSYLVTAVTAVSLGSFSLLIAVHRRGLRDVLVWVYGITIGLSLPGLCCGCVPGVAAISPPSVMLYMFVSPQGGTSDPEEPWFWINLGAFTGVHGLAALVCAVVAVIGIRGAAPRRRVRYPVRTRPVPVATPVVPDEPPPWQPYYTPPAARAPREPDEVEYRPAARGRRSFGVARLRADGDPFVWKERYFSGRLSVFESGLVSGCGIAVLSAVLFGLGIVLFFSVAFELEQQRWPGAAVNGPLRVFVTGGVLFLGLAVGTRAAGAVARERQGQTLDALLTIPVPRRTLLRAKAVAPLLWGRLGLIALGLALAFGLVTGGAHPLGVLAATALAAGVVAFLAALGVWVSVRCRTVTRATVVFLVWFLGLVFGPVLASVVVPSLAGAAGWDRLGPLAAAVVRQFSPAVGVWVAMFTWDDPRGPFAGPEHLAEAVGWVLAALGYGLGAAVAWVDAVRRFEREGRTA